jgi:hypothetical protein
MEYFNWKEFKGTGCQAVDMCAATIYAHRIKNVPIKAVHILPRMYGQYQQWADIQMKKLGGRRLTDEDALCFDGVYIEKGSDIQSTPIVIELWEQA